MSHTLEEKLTYSKFACVGTGISAIGLGATIQRWYGITDIQFFERHNQLGGTWYINKYPGCACDVPSALYSLSYEPNAEWSRILPSNTEIHAYMTRIATKYGLLEKMKFRMDVESCTWQEDRSRWRIVVRDLNTGEQLVHECQILFSAAGQLVYPRELDVPGVENFEGPIFHSARWRTDVDLRGKDVVIFGNGCTAAQIVPAIVNQTKSLTQMVRSKHWVFPPIDFPYPAWMRWMFKHVPLTLWLHRLTIFLVAENDFRLFPMTKSAARMRARRRGKVEKYMRSTAPKKYHDLLIPDFDVGCKRRIFDCGYLESMHAPNFNLTMEPAREIVPDGVRTDKGKIKADVIIMANGFRTNEFIDPMTITGVGGEKLTEHWARFGGPEAYNCSVLNKFPNFFMILGPNAATGHTSAIMASENTINYAMRVLKPVVDGDAEYVEITPEAEANYAFEIQDALKKTVWSSGCDSWYVKKNKEKGIEWNAMSYPYSQAHFWYRSLFPQWKDWFVKAKGSADRRTHKRPIVALVLLFIGVLLVVDQVKRNTLGSHVQDLQNWLASSK